MAGEQLDETVLGSDGIPGDRIVQVQDADGQLVTARTRARLLRHQATLGADGEPRVDLRPWTDPEVAPDVEQAAGPGTRLVRSPAAQRFDILPLLVATDGAINALGYDRRRFRPNLLVGGVEGFAERGWENQTLRIGDAILHMVDLRQRCVITTFDPDTGKQDAGVLRRIYRELDGVLALNCNVVRPGRVKVGDKVTVHPAPGLSRTSP